MKKIFSVTEWFEFESLQWHRAVRHRGLELRSLDPDERVLVFESIAADLERRKQKFAAREQRLGQPVEVSSAFGNSELSP